VLVYLAGAIDDAIPEAQAWRQEARELLAQAGYSVYDPAGAFSWNGGGEDAESILWINRVALSAAGAVLAELWLPCRHVGTVWELLMASRRGIPTVAMVGEAHHVAFQGLEGVRVVKGKVSEGLEALRRELAAHRARQQAPQELVWELCAARQVLKVQLGPGGSLPVRHYPGDAGLDLASSEELMIMPGETLDVPTGVRVQLPPGFWGLIIGRSSALRRHNLLVQPGVVDNGWRGELFASVRNLSDGPFLVRRGMRLAQLILIPLPGRVRILEVESLDPSLRGEQGFGPTG